MDPIAHVVGCYRYLVKSMAAQPLAEAQVGWHGIEYDRRYAFRRVDATGGFPWLTATRFPALIRYRPECDADADPSVPGDVRVTTPDGETFVLDDPALARRISTAYGHEVELMQLDRGTFDEASLSLISTRTIAAIAHDTGSGLDARRFRPNLVVEVHGDVHPSEDGWLGERLAIGTAGGPAIVITQRDARCSMINLDPETGASDPHVLKSVVQQRENFAGVYGVVVRPGGLRIGAAVHRGHGAAAGSSPAGMRTTH